MSGALSTLYHADGTMQTDRCIIASIASSAPQLQPDDTVVDILSLSLSLSLSDNCLEISWMDSAFAINISSESCEQCMLVQGGVRSQSTYETDTLTRVV